MNIEQNIQSKMQTLFKKRRWFRDFGKTTRLFAVGVLFQYFIFHVVVMNQFNEEDRGDSGDERKEDKNILG